MSPTNDVAALAWLSLSRSSNRSEPLCCTDLAYSFVRDRPEFCPRQFRVWRRILYLRHVGYRAWNSIHEVVDIPRDSHPFSQQSFDKRNPLIVFGNRAPDRRSTDSIPYSHSGRTVNVYDIQSPFQRSNVVIACSEDSAHLFSNVPSYGGCLLTIHKYRNRSTLAAPTKQPSHLLEIFEHWLGEIRGRLICPSRNSTKTCADSFNSMSTIQGRPNGNGRGARIESVNQPFMLRRSSIDRAIDVTKQPSNILQRFEKQAYRGRLSFRVDYESQLICHTGNPS